MIGVYFSGTGNTRHCVERFVQLSDKTARCFSLEDGGLAEEVPRHEVIVFGFPIYYSNIPKIAKDFIAHNANCFAGKKIFLITTMAFFNANGVGYARELFKRCGAQVIGSLQLSMPENIRDLWITQAYTGPRMDANKVVRAEKKIAREAANFARGDHPQNGRGPLNRIVGIVFKWLWFYPKTDEYTQAPKIDADKCTGCGKCVELCPMRNIQMAGNSVLSGNRCTICYRCCNNCPTQALTVLGRKIYGQYNFVKRKE